MAIGLVGQKCGMTRIFTEEGDSIPVTVIDVQPNRIVAIKTEETDGYLAIQVTNGEIKPAKVNKPLAGHFKKAGVLPGKTLCEFRLAADEAKDLAVGGELKVDLFKEGSLVDVTSKSRGKGYAGVVKKYHFSMQDATHGNSLSHRAPGSIGQRQTPGRVAKGKKMASHMGDVKRTVQNQKVVRVDIERNLLMVRGVVPGAPGACVIIKPAIKSKGE